MSSDNNQMAASSNEPPQVASTQARDEIPRNPVSARAIESSLPPDTVQNSIFSETDLRIETVDEQSVEQRQKVDPDAITIEEVTADSIQELRIVNDQIRNFNEGEEFYVVVSELPKLSAFAVLDGEKIGSVSCIETVVPGYEYKQLLIISLGVVYKHELLKPTINTLLLEQTVRMAEATNDTQMVSYCCPNENTLAMDLMKRVGFRLWKPTENFKIDLVGNVQYFYKPIVKNLPKCESVDIDFDDYQEAISTDGEGGAAETSEGGVMVHRDSNMRSIDLDKLERLKQSLCISHISPITVFAAKRLHASLFPTADEKIERLFENKLDCPELTCLAFFDYVLCGSITCEKVRHHDGSSHLSIVALGVIAECRGFGIGGLLLSCMIKIAKEMTDVKFLTAIVPASNDSAERLFKRFCFKQCGGLSEAYGDYQGQMFCKSTGN
uniref:N-acetyltransferase domain-containing protein n=1 Tax=Caenorhabditis tropicalis TaxID=1561998 RepID=A0A1I7U270_9PELO